MFLLESRSRSTEQSGAPHTVSCAISDTSMAWCSPVTVSKWESSVLALDLGGSDEQRGGMPQRRGCHVNTQRWLLDVQPSLSPFITVLSLVPGKERFPAWLRCEFSDSRWELHWSPLLILAVLQGLPNSPSNSGAGHPSESFCAFSGGSYYGCG